MYPPVYLLLSIVFVVLLHFTLPVMTIVVFPWNMIGILLLIGGGYLNKSAHDLFQQHETTVKPFEESNVLVTNKVFGFSRNPFYLGMVLIVAGVAVLFGTLSPWIVVSLFGCILHFCFILPEEKMLAETFGDAYLEYKKSVRRWI